MHNCARFSNGVHKITSLWKFIKYQAQRCRQTFCVASLGMRCGGLYFKKRYLFEGIRNLSCHHSSRNRYVRQSRQCSTGQICLKVAPSPGLESRCSNNEFNQGDHLLCQPPMDSYFALAGKIAPESTHNLSNDNPPVGWCCVVAPTSQTLRTTHPSDNHNPTVGVIPKLPGPGDASYEMAPDLPTIVRKILESRKVSFKSITLYLAKVLRHPSYNSGFKTFWAFCTTQNINVTDAPLEEIAMQLNAMFLIDPIKTKYAYAAITTIPGYDSLRFSSHLKICRQRWNKSQPKYATFWDAQPILTYLLQQPLDWKNIQQVRDRLIIALRIFQLCRSIDLQRCWRTMSKVGGQFFLRYKGKVTIPPLGSRLWNYLRVWNPFVPWHCSFIMWNWPRAVVLQGLCCSVRSPPPHPPLKANRIGRVTRQLLQSCGLQTQFWQPHSTRGAGVKFYKSLGLSSEQICEIGRWKIQPLFIHII